jgi:hypothetical protein
MRLIALSCILITSACGQAATDFGFNDFYLNCHDDHGDVQATYYVDEGRHQVSRLDQDGQFILVCNGECDAVHSDTTLKWTVIDVDGRQHTTHIDRRTGKLESYSTNPNASPVMMGGVTVPADLLGHTAVLSCERADGPAEAKF